MATIYDIAEKVGVSVATVSRVINGVNHPIKGETRQRILEAAQELNYRPNTIAKSLAQGRTHTVALLIPSITNNFYTQISEIIESKLDEEGYNIYLCNTKRSIEKESRYVENLIARRVDGVIFSPTRVRPEDNEVNLDNITELSRNNIAVVTFGSRFPNVSQIYINTYYGACEAVRYLLKLGHRQIGFIDGLTAGTRRRRRKGYMDTLKEAGIEGEELIISGDLEMEGGYRCALQLLQRNNPPTAVIAVNNLMAIGAIKAAKEIGIKIPEDLSVIGFDDSLLSQVIEPSLTVVKQPLAEIGKAAARLLIRQLRGETEAETVEFNTRLVIRQSCRAR